MSHCNECKFAMFEDYGYSNYTVEGTEFTCLKQAHPQGSFDSWYGENDKLKIDCGEFEEGDSVYIDVDMDGGGIKSCMTEEQYKLYEKLYKGE